MTLTVDHQLPGPPKTRVADALQAIEACERIHVATVNGAKDDLQIAVDAGRDAGMTWGAIADALGVRRGCAYQRYRLRAVVAP